MAAAVRRDLPPLEMSDKSFKEVQEEAIDKAKQIAGKTQAYINGIGPGKLVIIREIDSKDYGTVEIGVASDGRVLVKSWSPLNLITVHLITKRNNVSVVEDITQTCKSVCPDLFPEEKELEIGDSKHSLPLLAGNPAPAEAYSIYDPTAPQPNQAQQAAGAVISDRKPIDEANIKVHQGQSSGSPDCGGGCNSKGCTIM